MAYRILVPQLGIEPMPPAVEVQKSNHWTTGEVPRDMINSIPSMRKLRLGGYRTQLCEKYPRPRIQLSGRAELKLRSVWF